LSTPPGFTIWLTGLSGAGKSTLARAVQLALRERQRHVEVLDGDEVRENLSKGLGFSREDRDTNIRRIAYVARLVSRSGGVAITAAISPYRATRDEARAQNGAFVEVFVRCPLNVLVERDTKGLYAKALRGEIAQFTGVSDPYEEPLAAEVVVDTDLETVEGSARKVVNKLESLGYLAPSDAQIAPHGGQLINRLATPAQATALRDQLFALRSDRALWPTWISSPSVPSARSKASSTRPTTTPSSSACGSAMVCRGRSRSPCPRLRRRLRV